MTELKPCPFCGGDAIISFLNESYHAECNNALHCDVIPRTWGFDTPEEAMRAWNRRADNG